MQQLRLQLSRHDGAPAEVRVALRELDGLGWVLGDAMLLASELVTDSVLHSGCPQEEPIDVEVDVDDDHVVIAVIDCAGSQPGPRVESTWPSRMTLVLMRQLCRRWGTERLARRRVWCELPIPSHDGR